LLYNAVCNKQVLSQNTENLAQIRLVVFEKSQKTHPLILKNGITEPKAWLL